MIWSYLIHLSFNMWVDWNNPDFQRPHISKENKFRTDEKTWDATVEALAKNGCNMLLIDVGDGVKLESHPEIAIRGAWSVDKFKKKLDAIRALGITPIPKLNFSATHDAWMGKYAHMVSSDIYYKVVSEIIEEVGDIFGQPEYFHLGMDEETLAHQKYQEFIVIRQFGLWWKDLYFYIDCAERTGARAWVWSDYIWKHPEMFVNKMPKSVLQNNWYYSLYFDVNTAPEPYRTYVAAYKKLEDAGYEHVAAGSNYYNDTNMQMTVEYCAKNLNQGLLKGFMQTPWRPTLPEVKDKLISAADQLGAAKKWYESNVK